MISQVRTPIETANNIQLRRYCFQYLSINVVNLSYNRAGENLPSYYLPLFQDITEGLCFF
jgi:hypothetical protein